MVGFRTLPRLPPDEQCYRRGSALPGPQRAVLETLWLKQGIIREWHVFYYFQSKQLQNKLCSPQPHFTAGGSCTVPWDNQMPYPMPFVVKQPHFITQGITACASRITFTVFTYVSFNMQHVYPNIRLVFVNLFSASSVNRTSFESGLPFIVNY